MPAEFHPMSALPTAAAHSIDARLRLRDVQAADISAAASARHILGLDALRALAVLLVVVDHAIEGLVSDWISPSSLGVQLFFVLSGFLITQLLLKELETTQRIDFVGFYRRRMARLMPAFLSYIGVAMLLQALAGRPMPWEPVLAALLYVVNYYQAFTGAQSNIVSHCWSLAVEEQFYLLWPLLMLGLMRWRLSLSRALVALILAVWCWRWVLISEVFWPINVDYLYRALDTSADALAGGALLASLLRSPPWRERLAALVRQQGLGPLLGLLLIGGSMLEEVNPQLKYGLAFMLEVPLLALLVLVTVLIARQPRRSARWLEQPLLVHLGRISYGMYLWHGLVIYAVQQQTGRLGLGFWPGVLLAVLVLVLLSTLSWHWLEVPLRQRMARSVIP